MAKTLLRSTMLFSAMTFISRILGFVRDVIWAQVFGAVAGFDAFLVAFKIPNFMRRLFAEGAFSQAFVPVLSEYRETRTEQQVKLFIDHMFGTLALALLIVVGIFILLTPQIIAVFAPGFLDEPMRYQLAADMLKITAPYILLISLTAFCAGVLNSYSSFGVPAFAPVLLNVALIFAALVLNRYFAVPVYALAWGVFIGGILQLLFQLPFLAKKGLLPRPRLALRDAGVRQVLKLMIPAIFGVSVAQISMLVDTMFASFLPTGSITWLYYSERLLFFPLGMFGVALGTVVLPHLSRKHADRDPASFARTLDWALRVCLLVGLPSAIGLFMFAGPLLASFFQYGNYSDYDVAMTRLSLMAYAVGLPAFMLIKIFAAGFYSQQNIKKPVKIAVIAMVANIILNFILIFPLKHAGLALATSLAAVLNASLLFIGLLRSGSYVFQPGWLKFLAVLLIANGLLIGLLFFISPALPHWLAWNFHERVLHLSLDLVIAVLGYFAVLAIGGIRLKHFRGHGLDA